MDLSYNKGTKLLFQVMNAIINQSALSPLPMCRRKAGGYLPFFPNYLHHQ